MRIRTFDLLVLFKGYTREYSDISRTAVKYFLEYHRENPDYDGYDVEVHQFT